MRKFRILALVAATLALHGCAAVALTAGGLASGLGIDHTLNGIAYKTFASPVQSLRLAALKTLNHMAFKVSADKKDEKGWNIEASAPSRQIYIELEFLSPNTTRMKVVVNKGSFFLKDKSTGTEIIFKTTDLLDRTRRQARRPGKRTDSRMSSTKGR